LASAATVAFAAVTGSAVIADREGNSAALKFARYLLPPLPHRASQSGHERLQWVEPAHPADFPAVLPGLRSLDRVASKLYIRIDLGAPPRPSAAGAQASDFSTAQRVYVESELDRPVVRDPLSAAPEYPAELEKARVEGTVAVEYVVDTTGLADTASLRVVHFTNIDFADAVRHALPRMRFAPAELSGRHVAERVFQQFKFVIPPQTAANARSADTSAKSVNAR